ncbi:MAG: DNA polymerase/3'-5' exonuclease PolX [Phycisphaerae bacterium]|nr:DNA polymerase/3'-5' exonuclease PolX [Phycisphaerae bacterium]
MTNADIARAFAEIADLLEIQGADAFRVNSYRRVARTLEDLASDIHDVAARGELASLPGVGKSSAQKIQELLDTGRIAMRDELTAAVPESLLALLSIPSVGPKKVALLWKERGITSVADLKAAIEAGRLDGLKGFGAKSIEQIARGIEFLERSAGRTRLGEGWAVANQLRAALAEMKGVTRVEAAGSLRRGRETIGDLDLLCIAADGETIIRQFTELPGVMQVLGAGGTKGSILVSTPRGRTVQVDLRVVPAESFGAAWQYFTGSKEHNVRLRELAVKRGWSLNEYGLTEGKKVIASRTEEDVYAALDLPWIPPELREDRDEFEPGAVPDDLLTLEHIRGDLHMHTYASDGRNTIEEMATAAKARGYKYICITDHSPASAIANGLKPARLRAHIKDVRAAAEKVKGLTVWIGTEVDIHADGTLDYPDELLAELDFVTASIHAGMGSDMAANTRRTLAAMSNPHVHCIGHPTGRLINERDAMPLDMEAIAREAARTGTALEINANYYRLDLKDQHARLARDLGATILINTDAHATDQLEQMEFGVITARRAGLRKGDVLNTRPAKEVQAFAAKKRARG